MALGSIFGRFWAQAGVQVEATLAPFSAKMERRWGPPRSRATSREAPGRHHRGGSHWRTPVAVAVAKR